MNAEDAFAVGWSHCFVAAIKVAAAEMKVTLPVDLEVHADVGIGQTLNEGVAGQLHVSLPGMDRRTAQALVDRAHRLFRRGAPVTNSRFDIEYSGRRPARVFLHVTIAPLASADI